MAKIAAEARDDFNAKSEPYKQEIEKSLKKEKEILSFCLRDSFVRRTFKITTGHKLHDFHNCRSEQEIGKIRPNG